MFCVHGDGHAKAVAGTMAEVLVEVKERRKQGSDIHPCPIGMMAIITQ